MKNRDQSSSINLQGQRSLLSRTPWCSVLGLEDVKVPQQTPMSVLLSTSDTTPILCHTTMWLFYPVASAGCVNRPHPLGVGPFKLQLRPPKQMSCLPQFAKGWSCNLKGIKPVIANRSVHYLKSSGFEDFSKDPDAGVEFFTYQSTPTQQQRYAVDSIQ